MKFLTDIFKNKPLNGHQVNDSNIEALPLNDYETITGYASKKEIDLDGNKKNIAGRIAADLSRGKNVEIKNNYYPNAGKVNSYRVDILEQTFNTISQNPKQINPISRPTIQLGIDHNMLAETLDSNLEDNGFKKGTHHQGSLYGLESSLRIIYTDYLADVKKLDTQHRDTIINQINQFEKDLIKCDNQLRYISEVLIPDKQSDIDEIVVQLSNFGVKGLDSFVDLANEGNSEMVPILMFQKVNYKKTLNELKAKRISFENEQQQNNNKIEALANQLETFSYFSKDLLKNRLETFYNGWLKSYPLFEIEQELKDECAHLFKNLRDEILTNNH